MNDPSSAKQLPAGALQIPTNVNSLGPKQDAPIEPSQEATGPARSYLIWIIGAALKLLGVSDPPDTLKESIAKFVARFGSVIVFGLLAPLLCAFVLNLLDAAKAGGIADRYRDYVVSGFSINESIYRSDKERIDYLVQMRRVNFFEIEDQEFDPTVLFTAMPEQEGQIVIERATLALKPRPSETGGAGTGTQDTTPTKTCPFQVNPQLNQVRVRVTDSDISTATYEKSAFINNVLQMDGDFWAQLKKTGTGDKMKDDKVRSLRLIVLPPHDNQTKECFDLFVDLRVQLYKTRNR